MNIECRNELHRCLDEYQARCSRAFKESITFVDHVWVNERVTCHLYFKTIVPSGLLKDLYKVAQKYGISMTVYHAFIHFY